MFEALLKQTNIIISIKIIKQIIIKLIPKINNLIDLELTLPYGQSFKKVALSNVTSQATCRVYLQFPTSYAGDAALCQLADNCAGVHIAAPTTVKPLCYFCLTSARHLKPQTYT